MPDDDFAEVGGHHRQFALIAAGAVSVVIVAAAVIGVHSWRDTAVRSPAVERSLAATSLASPLESAVSSPSAVSASDPVSSSAPIAPRATVSSPSNPPRQHASATSRHTAPAVPGVTDESLLNFRVSMRLSPTHVVLGQQTRVTVTVMNAGRGVDPPAQLSIGAMVPVDEFTSAPSDCNTSNGGIECPIPGLRAGRATTISFTVTTAYYPGDSWDDEIYGQLYYADSYGQQQQLEPGYSADLWVSARTPSPSPPPMSTAPVTSTAPSTATPTPSPVG